jgi:hypothetical protein
MSGEEEIIWGLLGTRGRQFWGHCVVERRREKGKESTAHGPERRPHSTRIYGFRLRNAQELVVCASGRQERERTPIKAYKVKHAG